MDFDAWWDEEFPGIVPTRLAAMAWQEGIRRYRAKAVEFKISTNVSCPGGRYCHLEISGSGTVDRVRELIDEIHGKKLTTEPVSDVTTPR